jgi:hypothetical protein
LNRQQDFDSKLENLKQSICEKNGNINSLDLKIKSLENQLKFRNEMFASSTIINASTIPSNNFAKNNCSSTLHTVPPFINLTNVDNSKTKRLQQSTFLEQHISSVRQQCISQGGKQSRNYHYNSRNGYKKFPFQCDICDWSTPKREGINIHKAKEPVVIIKMNTE